jgi:predicted DNA-binding protein
VRLPTSAYDRLIVMAARRNQSVSAYVREVLILLTGSRDT